MKPTLDPATVKCLLSLGWTVADHRRDARKAETIADGRTLTRTVSADSAWTVTHGTTRIAWGTESHPALAACDANEAFWTLKEAARKRARDQCARPEL